MFDYYRQMSIFLKVVKAGSFRNAAKQLSITPSAVTHHVKKLEDSLGIRLYKRDLGRFELTRDGRQTVATFSEIIEIFDQKYQLLKNRSAVSNQTIRFSYASAIGTHSFYRFLSEYSRQNPEITLDLSVIDVREDIDESDKHLAIRVGWPESQPSGKTMPLRTAKSHILCSPKFKNENNITNFSDLVEMRWIYMRGLPFPLEFDHPKGKVEISPANIIYVNTSSVAYQLIYNSVGISTLLDFVVEADDAWSKVEILFPEYSLPDRQLFVSVRSDMWENRAVRNFANAIHRHFN